MFKSILSRYAAAAFVGATLAIGATHMTRGSEIKTDHYIVMDRVHFEDGSTSCTTVLGQHNAQTLAKYADDSEHEICVMVVKLGIDGVEQLPEEMTELIGIYPAEDVNGAPISFSVYLPSIRTK